MVTTPSQSEAAQPAPLSAAELKLQLEKRLASGQAAGTVPAAEAQHLHKQAREPLFSCSKASSHP